ncbi:hypothetical protein, partial [Klebsiella pneumoniae]|uniref:hypothetical protein n=1 Tax=Klebsiella pneumoniae TaxID=573 RepID=UPI001F4B5923
AWVTGDCRGVLKQQAGAAGPAPGQASEVPTRTLHYESHTGNARSSNEAPGEDDRAGKLE